MVSASAIEEVQIAVVERAENDSTLMQVHGCTGIFDEAPTDQPYPYISVGTKTETPWLYQTFGKREKEVLLVLDIWTDLDNGDGHFALLDDMHRLYHYPVDENDQPWPLPLSSYTNTDCVVEWSTTQIDESMSCRHTIVRLRTLNT